MLVCFKCVEDMQIKRFVKNKKIFQNILQNDEKCHIMFTKKTNLRGWGGSNMNTNVVEKLNRQGIIFALIHTIVLFNLAIDFTIVPIG